MADYKDTETFTADITKDLQPQVQAGNNAVIESLTMALSKINAEVGPQIVEGLRSLDTTPYAMNALASILTEQNANQALYDIAPLTKNLSYFAYRNPQVDFDPTLINTEAVRTTAMNVTSPQELAASLAQQGEVGSALTVGKLIGAAPTAFDASKIVEEFQTVLKNLNQSEVEVENFGEGVVGLTLTHPAIEGRSYLTAVGVVDEQGIWRPEVDGLGMDTPVQPQLLGVLQRDSIKRGLVQFGIDAIEPTPISPAPPTSSRPNVPTHTIADLENDPDYQSLAPEDQAQLRQEYYDRYIAPQQDAAQYEEGRNAYGGGSLVQAARNIPYVGRIAGQAADVVAQAGAAVTGATEGLIPPAATQAMRGVFGQRMIPEMLGQGTVDFGGSALMGAPFVGGVAMQGLRGAGNAAYEGKPLITTDIGNVIMPFTNDPKSIAESGAQRALQTALLGKALQYGIPATVGAVALTGKAAGAVARRVVPEGIQDISRQAMLKVLERVRQRGYAVQNERLVMEHVAAASPLSISEQAAMQVMSETPDVLILGKGATKVLMKDGRTLTPAQFKKEKEVFDALRRRDPTYTAGYLKGSSIKDIARIEGTATQVNKFYGDIEAGLKITGKEAAKGARVQFIKGNWQVIEEGGKKMTPFKTETEAYDYVDKMDLLTSSLEDGVFRQMASEGMNPYYQTFTVNRMKDFVHKFDGVVANSPPYKEVGANVFAKVTPPYRRFATIQHEYNIPVKTHMYDKMEAAIAEKNKWMKPWVEQVDGLLKRMKLGKNRAWKPSQQSKGYSAVLELTPGSKEWDDTVKQFGVDDQVARDTRHYFTDMLGSVGIDGEDFLTNILPRLKAYGGDIHEAYPNSNALPKAVGFFREAQENGFVDFADREQDIRTLLLAATNQAGFKAFASEAWEESVKLAEMLDQWPDVKSAAYDYLRNVRGWDTSADQRFSNALGTMCMQIFYGPNIPPKAKQAALREFLNNTKTDMSAGFFAYRWSPTFKQAQSLLTNVYPTLGEKYTMKGMLTTNMDDLVKASGATAEFPFAAEGAKQMRGGGGMRWMDRTVRAISAKGYGIAFKDHYPKLQAVLDGNPIPVQPTPQLTVPGRPMVLPKAGTLQSRLPTGAGISYNDPMAPGGRATGTVVGHVRPTALPRGPQVSPGMTRLYHGGGTTGKNSLLLTEDLAVAEAEAGASGVPLTYLDVPTKAALLKKPDAQGYVKVPAKLGVVAKPLPPSAMTPDMIKVRPNAGPDRSVNLQVESRNVKVETRPYGGIAVDVPPDPPIRVVDTGRPIRDAAMTQFLRDSKIMYLHPQTQKDILDLIENQRPMEALLKTMKAGADELNYMYSPQNRAPLLNTTIGRVFGDFQVYPTSHAGFIKDVFSRGVTMGDQTARLTRWAIANGIVWTTLAGTFGADAANYLFVYPAFTTGGPRTTSLTNFMQTAGRGNVTGAVIQEGGKIAWGQMPGSSAINDWLKVAKNPEDAARILITGMQPVEKDKR